MSDVGYSIEQVTGSPVDKETYPSVNQGRNVGGNVQGFVGVLWACDAPKRDVLTTMTYGTPEEADAAIGRWLERFNP